MTQEALNLPLPFTRTIEGVFGEKGSAWLAMLPALLDECAERWALTILPSFPNLSYNYVTPVRRADDADAVLKIGVPHEELWSEMEALRVYDGRGSVRLLESDSGLGAMLLERLWPGTPLTTLANEAQDAQATSLAAGVMRNLWRPAPPEHAFPTVQDWAQGMARLRQHFGGGTGPFPTKLVEEAETLFTELLASSALPVLLHGDLHHDNILKTASATKQEAASGMWVAIDPKGLVGEPAYEVGALLRNLWPNRHTIHNPQQRLERRVHQLAEELELERARVRGWGVEDGEDGWQETITVAQWLADIHV